MSALFKRAEQLKRWEESDTNQQSPVRKNIKTVSFPIDCAFLASVASGDKNEVNSLLYLTADINAANADGLTALHQACIDDNLDMVEFLVEHGADVNRGDKEGWTPLHATASCGFLSIAKYLLENGAEVSAINCDQELPIDIAESEEMRQLLHQYLREAGVDCDDARNKEERLMLKDAREWISSNQFGDSPHATTGAMAIHVAAAKGYIKVLELLIQAGADVNCHDYDGWTPLHAAAYWGQKEACEILVEHFCDIKKKNFVGQTAYDVSDEEMKDLLDELKKKQASQNKDVSDKNYLVNNKLPNAQKRSRLSGNDKSTLKKDKEIVLDSNRIIKEEEDEIKIKDDLPKDKRVEIELTPIEQPKPDANIIGIKDIKQPTPLDNNELKPPEVVLRRTQSFESDEKFYRRYCELRAKIKGNLWGVIHASPSSASASPPMRTASLKEKPQSRRNKSNFRDEQTNSQTVVQSNSNTSDTSHSTNPQQNIRSGVKAFISGLQMQQKQSETTHKIVPGNIFKNFFKSFVPPVRDDESETQRKAHAKRVRETRRSTQGVTLEELKSAEQIFKQKNQDTGKSKFNNSTQLETNNNSTNNIGPPQAKTEEHVTVTATITPLSRNIPSNMPDNSVERRPSWRLRVENGSKFLLEDARSNDATPKTPTKSPHIPSSLDTSADTTVTLPLRRPLSKQQEDEKEQDKENDCRNHQTTQAVIQRRKRPKRRSTGVVHVDLDEIDPDRQDTSSCGGTDESIGESGGDTKSSPTSRLSSVSSQNSKLSSAPTSPVPCLENGELDYKVLYEEAVLDNERLRRQLQKTEEELLESKITIEKQSSNIGKSTLSETEKRERRAMERKLSEMEEELKQLQKLKAENERLRTENRALTRVVSKLTHT
ncbi:protein phosphatase 1 regulatory subunit 12C isoform X3 [Adelges cooleyi]|uniref:protein phosphatase 1 regulatory subunit 12C isoform X3 n=1 Tax=Adelges cooleyi TaxID=133065 RepID=UPI00217F50EE|nr:protein phosphatase 1 regulatory subunit 12C isoform X3 [Adelges cooleyi]